MKGRLVRRYLLLSLLILVSETGVLWMLDRMISQDARFKSIRVLPPIVERSWALPPGTPRQTLGVSYEGRYVTYQEGERLVVADLAQRRVSRAIPLRGRQVSLLRWLPDRDRFLYATYRPDGTENLELRTFDPESGEERLLHDIVRRTSQSRVADLSLSPYNNLIYLRLEDAPGVGRVYRLDVMDDLYRARLRFQPSRLAVVPHEDRVIVEEAGSGKVWAVSGVLGTEQVPVAADASVSFPAALLGIDSRDEVYLGELAPDGQTVLSIKVGRPGRPFREVWRSAQGIPRDQLVLGQDDTLYAVDPAAGTIAGLAGRHRIVHFTGELVAFDGRLLATREHALLTVREAK